MKLELILRLLDNDELSPEEVNDVKDFLDDYVERNQVELIQISFMFFQILFMFFQVSSYRLIYFFLSLILCRKTLMISAMLMSSTTICH